jgi:tetratricopeptide (TPR) repeat protein
MIGRETFIQLIHSAQIAGRLDYARVVASDWLTAWPGDFGIRLLMAKIDLQQNRAGSAVKRLLQLIEINPECQEGYELLNAALLLSGDRFSAPIYEACAHLLGGSEPKTDSSPSWSQSLYKAVLQLNAGDPNGAVRHAQQALTADPSLPIAAYILLKCLLAVGDPIQALSLSRTAHDRWPGCLGFKLVLADEFLKSGQNDRGVEYLHRVAAEDITGEITATFLGVEHPYTALWPSTLKAKLSRPIPATVSAILGENHLPTPEKGLQNDRTSGLDGLDPPVEISSEWTAQPDRTKQVQVPAENPQSPVSEEVQDPMQPESWEAYQGPDSGGQISEALIDMRRELDRVAERINARLTSSQLDGRVPSYLLVSSRTRLIQMYGEAKFNRINEAIMKLVETIRKRRGWNAYRLYIDDPKSMGGFGLLPCDPGNPWHIKLRLGELDDTLGKRGEMIGALLIVGGDQVIPFHKLPNPTDDEDDFVSSDNPYATRDENYFAPEWSVGRLPTGSNPELLVELLQRITQFHTAAMIRPRYSVRLQRWIRTNLQRVLGVKPRATGYSASVWRRASMAVFRVIGEPRSLVTSPPVQAEDLPTGLTRPVKFSYFNLHGVEDAPEWFGQRDPVRDKADGMDFPVAFRPEDVVNSGRAPKVVFSEACYGANIINKTTETALSLKFLASGSHTVVGSTKISYGSVTPPLIAADLIGELFWKHVYRGVPVGEALRRAKLQLAKEMHDRQGFVDGEDQKTLISFVLFGDPLYSPGVTETRIDKKIIRRSSVRPETIKTACALGGQLRNLDDLSETASDRIKSIVSQYLPGMESATCKVHDQSCGCNGCDHRCPSNQIGAKVVQPSNTYVVSFAKQISRGPQRHPHYARLTLDENGKVLKLAVSR